jgi:hypothetical protein
MERDSLALSASSMPAGSSFMDSVSRRTPGAGQGGGHTVVFTALGGHGGSATDSLIVIVADTSGAQTVTPTDQWMTPFGEVGAPDGGPPRWVPACR